MLRTRKFDLYDRISPIIYNPKVSSDFEELLEIKKISHIQIIDKIESQVADLIKSQHPQRQLSISDLEELVSNFFIENDKETYGNWVLYPWKFALVHILPEAEFIRVRTVRNNYKITPSEQDELAIKKVGIVGLSVGQSVALAMALERSCGEMRLADFDTLELSNLNRLKAGITNLGEEKIIIAAREISEIDPYLKLTLYRDGITPENIDDFINKGGKLDLLIDECDSLDIKFLIREHARFHLVPVMMDTSDRGMLDVERFDIEPTRPLFHGLMEGIDVQSLKNISNTQKVAIVLKITGLETLSHRMKVSLLEIGQTITSWPQLASGVFLGGASVAHVGRRLLLGDPVPSGRFYVDIDEVIKIDIPDYEHFEIPPLPIVENFVKNLPAGVLPSGYILSESELHHLVGQANLAPSGGNIQPWVWVFDRKGVLHLFHDQIRSHSMLDYKGTGSLIAFGAALENLRLTSAKAGIEIELIYHIDDFEEECIASIRFVAKHNKPIEVPYSDLAEGIGIRCTNRKNTPRQLLSRGELNSILEMVSEEGMFLEVAEQKQELEELAEIVGAMDRMRFFHEQGLTDFIKEVRWSDKEAKETKDGIDIATLELSGTERAAMGLLKDPRTVRFFRKFLMGYGLTKISKDTLMSSSAIFLLEADQFSARSYLNSGMVLQRIWIKANMMGLSFQPVTAMLFIFHKVLLEKNHGFTKEEENEIYSIKESFNSLFNKDKKRKEIFMFRLNNAGEPSMKAYRRNVSDTLIII